jgi:hypothetical protein
MWQLLTWQKQALAVTALAILLAWAADALFYWLYGERAPLLHLISLFATIITVVVAGAASLTWRRLWRKFPVIARKTFPDLNGTWEGTLVSTWVDPATGKSPPPISVTIWIRQTPFSVSIKLRTAESTSHSTRCVLEAEHQAGRFRVWYSYDNQPKAEVAHRSARHEVVAWLEMDIDADQNRLAGQYYTSRRTTGDIALRRVSRNVKPGSSTPSS